MSSENDELENDELEESELSLAIKIFSVLRWVMVACSIFVLIGAIYLLFKGYAWYLVIPGYLVLNIFFKVMKTYFRNIAEAVQADQDELSEQTF